MTENPIDRLTNAVRQVVIDFDLATEQAKTAVTVFGKLAGLQERGYSAGKMSRKRFIKLLMSGGVSSRETKQFAYENVATVPGKSYRAVYNRIVLTGNERIDRVI